MWKCGNILSLILAVLANQILFTLLIKVLHQHWDLGEEEVTSRTLQLRVEFQRLIGDLDLILEGGGRQHNAIEIPVETRKRLKGLEVKILFVSRAPDALRLQTLCQRR